MQTSITKKGAGLFVLSLTVAGLGLLVILSVLQDYQRIMAADIVHEHLMIAWRHVLRRVIPAACVVIAGLCTALALLLRLSKRLFLQWETEALRKKNEAAEELNRQNQQLAHHQRLHIIGTLTSSIAHEFNNLLTPIMGYSLMALEKIPPENEELYDDLLEIYNASKKAKTIISRLSDLSRKNTGNYFRSVSVDDLVRKTLDVAAPAKPRTVTVRVDLNCWEQRIDANEIQLSQLLLNLLLNSFDAMEGCEEGVLEITTSFDDYYVQIIIRDNGCGIPEEVLPNIFEPFFTTKSAGKGTGLGLAIAAQVVADHQGGINVESHVGSGTSFIIKLPRTAELPTEE